MRLLGRRAEGQTLDRLMADTLAGRSRVTVLRGEPRVGIRESTRLAASNRHC
jgi:hypothetical protein